MINHRLLSKDDYLSVIAVLGKLQSCENMQQLRRSFDANVLESLNCHAFTMAWVDMEPDSRAVQRIQPFFSVNYPGGDSSALKDFERLYQASPHAFSHRGEFTVASVENSPARSAQQGHANTLVYSRENKLFFQSHSSQMASRQSDLLMVSRFLGREAKAPEFSDREFLLIEMVQPSLVKCLYSLATENELHRFRSLSEELINCALPAAVVSSSGLVLLSNKKYDAIVDSGNEQGLRIRMAAFLKMKMPNPHLVSTEISENRAVTFRDRQDKQWSLDITRLHPAVDIPSSYLLRLVPVAEGELEKLLVTLGVELTDREKDIAQLIRGGHSSRTIANQLLITENTIKTHLKNIHRKMGTSSRASLVSRLNEHPAG